MMRLRQILLLALVAVLTAACGQKGPLYLPDAEEHPAAAVEEPEEEEGNGPQA